MSVRQAAVEPNLMPLSTHDAHAAALIFISREAYCKDGSDMWKPGWRTRLDESDGNDCPRLPVCVSVLRFCRGSISQA